MCYCLQRQADIVAGELRDEYGCFSSCRKAKKWLFGCKTFKNYMNKFENMKFYTTKEML